MVKRTVLVVDDQDINRKILGRLLMNEYEILYAKNGVEAMELLHENAKVISAVLLDIVMPEMDGYAVMEAMGKDAILSKIPIIVSSQKDGDDAEIRALSMGAQDFIAKPYKADIIRHRLKNTIRLRETAAIINRAERDELTGLYNKQFFIEKVRERIDTNPEEEYDLLCFGVERFKLINDTFGIAKGDQALCYLGKILSEASEEVGICGRFSADEFYTLLKHKDHYSTHEFKRWLDKVNEFPVDMEMRIHCGIYEIKDVTVPVSVMCDRAQLASDNSRGKYDAYYSYYDDSIRQKLMEEQFIISNMKTALEQHQFQVYYQPKYDLNSEMIAGAEALVRWIHPEKGFLSPGAFIPLFESNGFITPLDRYVWETVCQDIRSWMDLGYPAVSVSVNVSRADIYNPRLTDIFLDLIAKYKIPLQYLHLEITESAYTDNPDQIIKVVNKLRNLGFVIEMDDFGSGYSSLNMLAEMPVDVLKLDMKFIQNQSKITSGKGILSFVISLAKWLDLAVVAEGVETAEQIASLRSMDCNYVQGFYYARPMKKDDFERLLRTAGTTQMVCTSRTVEQYVDESRQLQALSEGRKMLVVDDIEVNRAVLAGIFLEEYVIVEKENGREAWDYLIENYQDVDIVMLDLLMPVMDGFAMLEKIRSDSRTEHIPVIITSQGDGDSEQRALELKADDFISKPYKPEIIRHRVHNVLASYQLEDEKRDKELLSEALSLAECVNDESGSKDSAADASLVDVDEHARRYVEALKPHFDIVRLVDPRNTMVCETAGTKNCDIHSCFSVWGKHTRCNNCISLKALENYGRCSKLEYSEDGLYFVISEYIPYGDGGAVVEMVTKLEDEYVDNVFDKSMLYLNLDRIHQQLEYDELTGVFNRRHIDKYLQNYLDSAKKRQKDLGIAMVDLDSFKVLNDTHGHLAGDEALTSVAKILETNIALSKGDFVARFGGDEFMVVCRDIPPETFAKRIASVVQLVKHITSEDGRQMELGISAGCVNLSEFPDYTVHDLISKADERLYGAKHSGRGRVVAVDGMVDDIK